MKIESKFNIGDIVYYDNSFSGNELEIEREVVAGFMYKMISDTDFSPTLFVGFGQAGWDSEFDGLIEESKCFGSEEKLIEYYKNKQEFGNL